MQIYVTLSNTNIPPVYAINSSKFCDVKTFQDLYFQTQNRTTAMFWNLPFVHPLDFSYLRKTRKMDEYAKSCSAKI